MIFAHHPFDHPNLKGFAGLPNEFSNPLTYIPYPYFVTIFSHPYQMVFNLVNRVAPIPIVHLAPCGLLLTCSATLPVRAVDEIYPPKAGGFNRAAPVCLDSKSAGISGALR
jgi:hypothetical protein